MREPGCTSNSHANEEVWHIIEGQFEVMVAGQVQIVGPGSAVVVPANTPHSVKALTDGRSIVVDYPLRDSVGGVDIR
jgi:quercetin dioxygenase-like cupin family protein